MLPQGRIPVWAKLLRLSLFWIRNQHAEKPLGERLRLALESLGPVFVKLGQMLSTRRDLLPPEMILELSKLQDRVPPFPGEQAQVVIEKALGFPLTQIFSNFEVTPLASASIAQVHAATLRATEKHAAREVVVKVIRPDIL